MANIDLATQLQQLYQRFGQLPGVHIELHQNLVAVFIQSPKAQARVFLQGAQVSHFQPRGQAPVLFLSEANRYQQGQPLRGGIPISWPWFADLGRNPESLQHQFPDGGPAHGFLRTSDWQLDDIRLFDDIYELELSWQPDPEYGFFNTRLSATIRVADALSIELKITNLDSQTWYYATALHSYFRVSDITNIRVTGLEGTTYLDCLQQWQSQHLPGALTVDQEVDRVFPTVPNHVRLEDPGLNRAIELTSHNLPSLVTWNPWIDKGAQLSQFQPADYKTMMCLENAALLDNLCQLAPNETQSHRLNVTAVTL